MVYLTFLRVAKEMIPSLRPSSNRGNISEDRCAPLTLNHRLILLLSVVWRSDEMLTSALESTTNYFGNESLIGPCVWTKHTFNLVKSDGGPFTLDLLSSR